jgi:hypothetical protein
LSEILPDKLRGLLRRLVAIDDELASKRAAAERRKSRITLDLTAAKDLKTGKLVLTNDKQRDAAVAEFLEQDAEFLDLFRDMKTFERERSDLQIELDAIRVDIKYDLQRREKANIDASLELADKIWHLRQAPDAWSPERVRAAVSSGLGGPVDGPPEFFRGPGLHIIDDSAAGTPEVEDDDVPF